MILYKKRKNGGKKSFLQRGVFQEPINRVVGGLPVFVFTFKVIYAIIGKKFDLKLNSNWAIY